MTLMFVGFLAMAVASTGRSWLTAQVGGKLITAQRLRLFDHLQHLPPQ